MFTKLKMAPARPLSFVQQLEKAPRGNVILASIGISLTTAGFFWAIMMSRGIIIFRL